MRVGMGHAASSVEKCNPFNLIDGLHLPGESLTEFHYSRCEVSRNIVKRLEVTSRNDQTVASSYGPVVKKRYNIGILPHDHRTPASGGYFAKRTRCHIVLIVYFKVSQTADALRDARFANSIVAAGLKPLARFPSRSLSLSKGRRRALERVEGSTRPPTRCCVTPCCQTPLPKSNTSSLSHSSSKITNSSQRSSTGLYALYQA